MKVPIMSDAADPRPVPAAPAPTRVKKKYVPAVTPKLKIALIAVFVLFATLLANSVYLASITLLEAVTGLTYQDYFYLLMFLLHLVLGFLLLVPFTIFAWYHLIATRHRRNRMAVRMGYALLAVCLTLLISGILLTRIAGILELKQPLVRQAVYWAHVITPFAAIWLYWLHRVAGPPIKWRAGLTYAAVVAGVVAVLLVVKAQNPQEWAIAGSPKSANYFEPSLARTRDGKFISASVLMDDDYCMECHQDIYDDWAHSAHRFSSFNNPAYLTSVVQLRDELMERDGNVKASRWCAGCHDPVPFFSGQFDDPQYDVFTDKTAHAGITCTVCHVISHVNSLEGNADYTIEAPIHYPFATSENPILAWVNRQLVKSKPSFHKQVFLKPLHKEPDFCAACHKVSLPGELNNYKDWLRGQNHFDSYHLSGVSGHGIRSFYYPPKAQQNCNECHMPRRPSDDFGASMVEGELKVHDHLFPSANTALSAWFPDEDYDAVGRHRAFNEGVMRVDLFGVKRGEDVSAPLVAPLRPEVPTLEPGESYLFETVIRTLKMGHHFTQGTVDSNEIWLDVEVVEGAEYDDQGQRTAGRVIGRSGGIDDQGNVDPWSHFVNVFMLDRDGNRINRRNAQHIFVPLYNHQIPPGAGQAAHFLMPLPNDLTAPVTVEVKLKYRKFDAEYMRIVGEFHRERQRPLNGLVEGEPYRPDLPILTLASDRVTFPVAGVDAAVENPPREIPEWQRWNDYGIGLLLESTGGGAGQGELIGAEEAFRKVEELGQFHGPINLARVYNADGRLDLAVEALTRAAEYQDDENYPAWTVLWLTGLVNRQQNHLDDAIENFRGALNYRTAATVARGFDFTQDYEVLNELAFTLFERSKKETGTDRTERRLALLDEAIRTIEATLAIDSEHMTAHYLASQIYDQLSTEYPVGSREAELWSAKAEEARKLHARYKPDENARDRAVALARARYPAANAASEAVVIYRLRRPGAFQLPEEAWLADDGSTEAPSGGDVAPESAAPGTPASAAAEIAPAAPASSTNETPTNETPSTESATTESVSAASSRTEIAP
ncbi:MAG TPA: multiheme c-type cytochrome [Pirellulaceae bacterium]|nr:multiheme c-type cytochrome [Pirellulaceae bacterium]